MVAAILWPMLLAGAAGARIRGDAWWFSGAVYHAGGAVCHQLPSRSFHIHGTQWPVCARCSGLYLAAPVGALAAVLTRRRFHRSRDLGWLGLASLPTVIAFALEHGGLADVTSFARFAAALPLGAGVAWVIVAVAGSPASGIE